MPVATLRDVLQLGRKQRVGVPNLWAGTIEKLIGHIRAAERIEAPICLCYNHALCPEIEDACGFEVILAYVRRSTAPIAVILDHGHTVEDCVRAIQAGASGVMYDGSHLPFEENVANTCEVVRFAHAVGVSIEGEVGVVGGSALEYGKTDTLANVYTDPDQAEEFARETKVDALAVSVGNSHGLYRGTPRIQHDLIREIHRRVPVPLVMHGASGLPESEYARIIDSGITKINYYSEMSRRATERLKRFLQEDDGSVLCHNYIRHMIAVYTDETDRLLRLLGHQPRAARSDRRPASLARAEPDFGPLSREIDVEEIKTVICEVLAQYRQ